MHTEVYAIQKLNDRAETPNKMCFVTFVIYIYTLSNHTTDQKIVYRNFRWL